MSEAKSETPANQPTGYEPGKVWAPAESGGKFASINAPTAGARFERALPKGKHSYQLHSMATPNGVKVCMLLEELNDLQGVEYDAYAINIMKGDQFGSEFVQLNPNSKIPALFDHSVSPPIRLFESGSILHYLADKHAAFYPKAPADRAECMNWLMWQMAAGPYLGGGFGHFFSYAPFKMQYPIDRFSMEAKRQLDVLDKHLATHKYMVGDDYTIADMAIWPWYGQLVRGNLYTGSDEFLQVKEYKHLLRWSEEVWSRPATQRAHKVNRFWGEPAEQLHERHCKEDFETNTQDKLQPKKEEGDAKEEAK
jgi:GST-like protein